MACNLNHSKACYNLAMKYKNEDGVEKNLAKASLLYNKSCELGNAKACYNLGVMYVEGEYFLQDYIILSSQFQNHQKQNFFSL